MGSFCGSTTTTQTSQQGSQSGRTQNNLLPQIQQAAGTLFGTYGNLGSAGANQYQYDAAKAQKDVAGNLAPGYQAAGNIAQNGIDPLSISRFMNPYLGQVVQAYGQQQDLNDAQALSQQGGSAAKLNALTASTAPGAEALLRSNLQAQRNLNTANLLNSGYGQAANLAQQSASAQLQGAGTLGSLTGTNTAANTGLGALGQGIQQANLSPYDLASKQAASTAQLASTAGQSYSGQSSGTSSGTQTQNEPLLKTILGGVGLAMGLPFNEGGAVDDHAEQVAKRFHTLKTAFRSGGQVKGYDDGGAVGNWVTTYEREPDTQSKLADFMQKGSDTFGMQQQDTSMLRNQQGALAQFMSNMQRPQGMADGGAPDERPAYLNSNPGWSPVQTVSPWKQFAHGLMAASNITAPIAQTLEGQQKQRIEEEQNKRAAYMQAQQLAQQAQIAAGKVSINGQSVPTLAAQKLPAEIASLYAHGEPAQRNKMDYEHYLAHQKDIRDKLQNINDQEALGTITPQEAAAMRASITGQAPPRNPYPAPVQKGTWAPGQGVKIGQ